jgi:hypothetical protein
MDRQHEFVPMVPPIDTFEDESKEEQVPTSHAAVWLKAL